MHLDLKKINKLNILIIGDIILDKYIYGEINRQSPEAPIPVIDQQEEKNILGGAANVAYNLHTLGASPVLIGTVGNDKNGTIIKQLYTSIIDKNIHIIDCNKKTTTKTRVVVDGRQILRIDDENTTPINEIETAKLIETVTSIIESNNLSGLILQDYNKGILTKVNIKLLIEIAHKNNIPVFADPKHDNFWEYKHVDFFKPNNKELLIACRLQKSQISEAAVTTLKRLSCKALIVTLAQDGIMYLTKDKNGIAKTVKIEQADVSGAGDTTLAMMVIAYLTDHKIEDIAQLGNIAGMLVCKKPGVSTIKLKEVQNCLNADKKMKK